MSKVTMQGVEASSEPPLAETHQLPLFDDGPYIDVELFAGAGGLTLGLSETQLAPDLLFEVDKYCCETLLVNSPPSGCLIEGKLRREDVGVVDWDSLVKVPVRILSGGPPCQPFSLAGKHLADRDERNEFPSMLRAVRALRPAALLIENVHGLARSSFRPYLEYIIRQIKYPDISPREEELWMDHDARIQKHQNSKGVESEYNVCWDLVNAADFGVPQARSRVVIVAARRGYDPPVLPRATHSMESLIKIQESGSYWRKFGLKIPKDRLYPKMPPGCVPDPDATRSPWRTVREALATLPKPGTKGSNDMNHQLIPGARLYRGHQGSDLDWVAKTIKAGVHGVAGGENIILLDSGAYRYFTLREMARLQGFPDNFIFKGPRSRIISQIGNAVPCELARVFGAELVKVVGSFDGLNLPACRANNQRG